MVMDSIFSVWGGGDDERRRQEQASSQPAVDPLAGQWRTETPPQMTGTPPQQQSGGGGGIGGFLSGLANRASDIGSGVLDAYNQYWHNPVQSAYDQGGIVPALNTASQQATYISGAPGRTVDNALPDNTPGFVREAAVTGANFAPWAAATYLTGGTDLLPAAGELTGGTVGAVGLPKVSEFLQGQGGVAGQAGDLLRSQVVPESIGGVQVPFVGGARADQLLGGLIGGNVGGGQMEQLTRPREAVGTGGAVEEASRTPIAEAGRTLETEARPPTATGTAPPPEITAYAPGSPEALARQAGIEDARRGYMSQDTQGIGDIGNSRIAAYREGLFGEQPGFRAPLDINTQVQPDYAGGPANLTPQAGTGPGMQAFGEQARSGLPGGEATAAVNNVGRTGTSGGAKIGSAKPGGGSITISDWLNLPRSLMAGGDASMSLRQSIVMAFAHPLRWAESMRAGLKAFTSDEAASAVEARIAADPLRSTVLKNVYQSPVEKGAGTIASREEGLAPHTVPIIERVPVAGKPVAGYYRATERGTITQLNQLRYDVSKDYALRRMRSAGETPETITPKTQADINRYVDGVNKATGRGTLGSKKLEEAIAPLSQAFFSWRNAISKPQYALKLLEAPGSAAWRATVADQASFLVGGAVTLGLIDYLAHEAGVPATVGLDPRSADFGKAVIGNTHIDIWGGFQQPARLAWQSYMAATGQENAVTQTGRGYTKNLGDLGLSYLGNKLSPQAAIAGQLALSSQEGNLSEGTRDALRQVFPEYREPKANLSTLASFTTPLWGQAMVTAMKDELEHGGDTTSAALKGLGAGGAEFFGVGANTYDQPFGQVANATNAILSDPAKLAQAFPESPRLQHALQGKEYQDLLPTEKKALQAVLDPADVKAMKDESARLSPATVKHSDILDTLAQKKIADEDKVLDAYNAGKLDKEHTVYGMKLAQREYYAAKDKADADPAYQKELDAAKKVNTDPTQAQRALDAYYQIEGKDARQEFIQKLNQLDPGLAARIVWAVQPRNQSRLEQMYAAGELK